MEQVGSGEANVRTGSTVETPKPPKFLLETPHLQQTKKELVKGVVEESDCHFKILNIIFGVLVWCHIETKWNSKRFLSLTLRSRLGNSSDRLLQNYGSL